MKGEYISIAEFAKRAGVSRQAVYNRLDKDLSSYCQVDNGKKTLNIKALELFEPEKMSSNLSTKVSTDTALVDTIKLLQKTVDLLEGELKIKDDQIADLQKENQKLSQELLSLSGKVGNSLEAIVQSQLADRMIEGQRMVNQMEQEDSELDTAEEKKWWQFWK